MWIRNHKTCVQILILLLMSSCDLECALSFLISSSFNSENSTYLTDVLGGELDIMDVKPL